MQIPQQIESISIARAANAAHYEYLATVRKRTEEIQLDHERGRKTHPAPERGENAEMKQQLEYEK